MRPPRVTVRRLMAAAAVVAVVLAGVRGVVEANRRLREARLYEASARSVRALKPDAHAAGRLIYAYSSAPDNRHVNSVSFAATPDGLSETEAAAELERWANAYDRAARAYRRSALWAWAGVASPAAPAPFLYDPLGMHPSVVNHVNR